MLYGKGQVYLFGSMSRKRAMGQNPTDRFDGGQN